MYCKNKWQKLPSHTHAYRGIIMFKQYETKKNINLWANQILDLAIGFVEKEDPMSLVAAYKLCEKIQQIKNVDEDIYKAAEGYLGTIRVKLLNNRDILKILDPRALELADQFHAESLKSKL